MKKIIIILVSLLCLYGYFHLSKKEEEQNMRPTISFVEIYQVKQDKISNQIEALGIAKANEFVEITSNVTEIIKEIKFVDNASVKKGDDIVILQADEEMAERNAEDLQLQEHKRELKRLQKLVKGNAVSTQLLDQRKTLIEISKQKITAIDSKISDRLIRAPFDGVLGLRHISEGTLVKPGDLITTIDDISKIKIDFWVPSVYLSNLYIGMPILVKSESYQDKEFKGVIGSIDSRVDESSGAVKVRAIIDNVDLLLRPGLLLNVTLLSNTRDAILVHEEALVAKQDKHYLFVLVDENKVQKKEVKIGYRLNGMVEITDNLSEGEIVVITGVLKIGDGSIVSVLNHDGEK